MNHKNPLFLHFQRSHGSKSSNQERDIWSGDKNRNTNYNLGSDATVTISMGGEDAKRQEAAKEVPIWMSKSTVEGGQEESRVSRYRDRKGRGIVRQRSPSGCQRVQWRGARRKAGWNKRGRECYSKGKREI